MKWMAYLQQFNLVIKYKKGITNKLADWLSRPPTSVTSVVCGVVMQVLPLAHEEYKELYSEDGDFKSVVRPDGSSSKSTKDDAGMRRPGVREDFRWENDLLFKGNRLCIPKGADRVGWIREAHSSKVAGHFGCEKTLKNLERYVYWPRMRVDVERFIRGCTLCNISKPTNRKMGLYMPLPVPSRPWESISMDFLGGLPRTKRGHDYIFVVVDRFSKMICLIPCKKTVTGEDAARLFFTHVWRHFGMPTSIVSDRDSCFLGKFWRSLWDMMDTKLNRSTAFHPQTDGQTEVVNRTLVHLLRGYNAKHPKTWDESLPYIEFAFNRAMHGSTARAPFEVCLGYTPQGPFDLAFTPSEQSTSKGEQELGKAQRFLEHIRKVHEEVESRLKRTQAKYKERHDRHRVPCTFQVGDRVWLHLGKERFKGEGRKLKARRYGPFKILKKYGDNAFQLDLPPYMSIYSVVNADKLKLFEPSMLDEDGDQPLDLPAMDEMELGQEMPLTEDSIVERKVIETRGGSKRRYRIGLRGSLPSKAKWYTEEEGRKAFPHLEF
jgi:hypothetical protein